MAGLVPAIPFVLSAALLRVGITGTRPVMAWRVYEPAVTWGERPVRTMLSKKEIGRDRVLDGSAVAAPARVCPHGKLSPKALDRDLNEAGPGLSILEEILEPTVPMGVYWHRRSFLPLRPDTLRAPQRVLFLFVFPRFFRSNQMQARAYGPGLGRSRHLGSRRFASSQNAIAYLKGAAHS